MKKFICAFMSAIIMYYTIVPIAIAAESPRPLADSAGLNLSYSDLRLSEAGADANNDTIRVFIDGEAAFSFRQDSLPEKYIPAAELSESLGGTCDLCPDGAVIYTSGYTTEISYSSPYIVANKRYIYTPGGIFADSRGFPALPLDAAARIFGYSASWDDNCIYFYKNSSSLLSGDEFYNPDDLYWLSRIISAEARGEILDGKISVGNVILNRVRSDMYPDSIYGVIFDDMYGIQFTPASDGSVYDAPTEESVIAAKLVLDGADAAGDCLYFAASYIADSCWAGQNREYFAQIGNHCFFR